MNAYLELQLPRNCGNCRFMWFSGGAANKWVCTAQEGADNAIGNTYDKERMPFCPLIPIVAESSDSETVGNISLRDYLAGQALAGMCSIKPTDMRDFLFSDELVRIAYDFADAMMKQRDEL